jgi:hypothetical protein
VVDAAPGKPLTGKDHFFPNDGEGKPHEGFQRNEARLRMPGAMDDMNPADLTVLQPHFNSVRMKPGLGEKVLNDASGLLPCGLVLFEDN